MWAINDKLLTKEEFKEEFIKIFKPKKYRTWKIISNVFGKIEADSIDNLIVKYNNLVKYDR